MSNYLKTGGSSVVLGSYHYKDFTPHINGKLLKISKISNNHSEFKYIKLIEKIKNHSNYYSIPNDELNILQPSDKFYKHLMDILDQEDQHILKGPLHYFYIDNAGDKDLHDTLSDMKLYQTTGYWDNYKLILKFTLKIMSGLMYLHKNKICHLDVKPENIMINTISNEFKLIDFGFSSVEPFQDYISNLRCTVGYFPANFKNDKIEPWLPIIYANDLINASNGKIPIKNNFRHVYKIDSFCFGRVLFYLKYMYEDNVQYTCFPKEKNIKNKIQRIINYLTLNNVYDRLTIEECFNIMFNESCHISIV